MSQSAEQDISDFVEYAQVFQAKLDDAVSQALDVDPMIGGLRVMSLYPTEVQMAAAAAGHKVGIPHELAIAFLVSAEAISFEKRSRRIKLFMKQSDRQKYKAHEKLMKFVWPVVEEMSTDALSERFFSELTREMSQTT
jgi:hypothetical protein